MNQHDRLPPHAGPGLLPDAHPAAPVALVPQSDVTLVEDTDSDNGQHPQARVLDHLNGRLPVATPELVAHGEYENGWRYVLMSQLPGTELAAAWPAIPRPHQDRVASEAGEMLAALHSLDPGPQHAILGPADWAGFLAGQRATAAERQRAMGLPDPWLSRIDGFLESVPLMPGPERVLLHTR